MKAKILSLLLAGFVVAAVGYTTLSPKATNANAASAAAAEKHREIHDAIDALRRAKDHMEHAAHDYGGHRVEAIRATDEAIHQLEDCLRYD